MSEKTLCIFTSKSKYFMSLYPCVCSVNNICNKIIIEAKDAIHTILKHSYYLCALIEVNIPKYGFLIY